MLGLEIGADDYLCKPFSMRELMARVKVLMRRATLPTGSGPDAPEQLVRAGDLVLDPLRLSVTWKGIRVPLTVTEFLLLQALALRPGVVKSRDADDGRCLSRPGGGERPHDRQPREAHSAEAPCRRPGLRRHRGRLRRGISPAAVADATPRLVAAAALAHRTAAVRLQPPGVVCACCRNSLPRRVRIAPARDAGARHDPAGQDAGRVAQRRGGRGGPGDVDPEPPGRSRGFADPCLRRDRPADRRFRASRRSPPSVAAAGLVCTGHEPAPTGPLQGGCRTRPRARAGRWCTAWNS